MNIIIVLINWLFKISCRQVGDQKLMINLEWPYHYAATGEMVKSFIMSPVAIYFSAVIR
jgi:hypothetical protein